MIDETDTNVSVLSIVVYIYIWDHFDVLDGGGSITDNTDTLIKSFA